MYRDGARNVFRQKTQSSTFFLLLCVSLIDVVSKVFSINCSFVLQRLQLCAKGLSSPSFSLLRIQVDANHQLGFSDELRTYGCVPGLLDDLGVKSVKLLTNNPFKVSISPLLLLVALVAANFFALSHVTQALSSSTTSAFFFFPNSRFNFWSLGGCAGIVRSQSFPASSVSGRGH